MFKPEAIVEPTDAATSPNEEESFSVPETRDEKFHEEDKSKKSVEEIIAFRKKQSFASRLSERITGLRPDDAGMAERLIADRGIIRSKYGLPLEGRGMPNEYEIFLRNYAEKLGVAVRPISDCGSFSSEHSNPIGVYMRSERQIGVDIDKENMNTHSKGVYIFEHELIHALQHRYFPSMPIELREYEAYLAGISPSWILSNEDLSSADRIELLFSFLIGGSVMMYYRGLNKDGGKDIRPEWDNPKFFLEKVDRIEEKELEGS